MKLDDLHEEVVEKQGVVIVKPPERPAKSVYKTHKSVFLAGSIEMGKAEDWQEEVTKALIKSDDENIAIFNPRRDDWDSSWEQTIENENFEEQVTWELDHLEAATVIALYFDPKTKAPISLLELGLHANDDKIIICCPDGYWRKGNVEIMAKRFNIPLIDNMEEFLEAVRKRIESE